MIYLSRSIRALPGLPSLLASLLSFSPLSLVRPDRGTEEGDEGITWTLVKQLNGPSEEEERGRKQEERRVPRVRVKWLKKSLRLNGASKRRVFLRQFVGMIVTKTTVALFRCVLHLDQSTFNAIISIM